MNGDENKGLVVRRCCRREDITLRPIWRNLEAVGPDLMAFTTIEKILVFLFGVISVVFSIFDFNVLIHPDSGANSTIKFINDYELYGIDYWRRVIMCLSGVCSFTGVLGVVLTTKRKRSNYFWGLINSVLYGIYAFAYGYAGDAQLYIVYFTPMQIVGMYTWDKDQPRPGENVYINPLKWYMGVFYAVLLVGIAVAFYFEIPVFARSLNGYYSFDPATIGTYAPLILDASSNGFNFVAQLLNINRHWQQWPAWISVNLIQIAMWSGVSGYPPDFNILFMWSLFLINSLFGTYIWYTNSGKVAHSTMVVGEKVEVEPSTHDTLDQGVA